MQCEAPRPLLPPGSLRAEPEPHNIKHYIRTLLKLCRLSPDDPNLFTKIVMFGKIIRTLLGQSPPPRVVGQVPNPGGFRIDPISHPTNQPGITLGATRVDAQVFGYQI